MTDNKETDLSFLKIKHDAPTNQAAAADGDLPDTVSLYRHVTFPPAHVCLRAADLR